MNPNPPAIVNPVISERTPYRGRFAPSPTGPLHIGSLTAALASYLDAKSHSGRWLVRIEDVDETRSVKGMADHQLRTLESFGFEWDEEVIYQSQRKTIYSEYIDDLRDRQLAYPCSCSRAEIADSATYGQEGHIYPGSCRNGVQKKQERSIRLRTNQDEILFNDRIQGELRQNIESQIGDFVIRRADGFTAYQLAVVIDDTDQEINQIVRGADLLLSTPRQIYLQGLMDMMHPGYAHIPLLINDMGQKISKQDKAQPVETNNALNSLLYAYTFLGQHKSGPLPETIKDFFPWAIQGWDINKIRRDEVSQSNEQST